MSYDLKQLGRDAQTSPKGAAKYLQSGIEKGRFSLCDIHTVAVYTLVINKKRDLLYYTISGLRTDRNEDELLKFVSEYRNGRGDCVYYMMIGCFSVNVIIDKFPRETLPAFWIVNVATPTVWVLIGAVLRSSEHLSSLLRSMIQDGYNSYEYIYTIVTLGSHMQMFNEHPELSYVAIQIVRDGNLNHYELDSRANEQWQLIASQIWEDNV